MSWDIHIDGLDQVLMHVPVFNGAVPMNLQFCGCYDLP